MDTILLVIGVVGLSISGWVLRGYFINTSPTLTPVGEPAVDDNSVQEEPGEEPPISYVTSEDHQLVLKRLAELEKGGHAPKVDENVNLFQPTGSEPSIPDSASRLETNLGSAEEPSDKWKEIFALQEAYKAEREKESDIDYEREQTLFDISQGYDGRFSERPVGERLTEEEDTDQRLLDNQLEEGEDLAAYQERLSQFASLSKEMLIMRLEASDTLLREQQKNHQEALLKIIATLIERMPGDVNLKSIAQSSYVAASSEISNQDGETNRDNFQEMFFKAYGYQ